MKFSLFLFVFLSSCGMAGSRYLLRKRKGGKEFRGRNYEVMEGDNLIMPCHSRPKYGKNSVWAFFWQVLHIRVGDTWFNTINLVSQYPMRKPFNQKHLVHQSNIISELIPNTRKLLITNITRNATAKYRCVVVSKTKRSDTYVDITYYSVIVKAPAKIVFSTKSPIHLSVGSNLELECKTSGYPRPKISWTRQGDQPVLTERTFKRRRGLLTIQNVGQADGGVYTCNASNQYASDYRHFVVHVKVPARIITTKKISYAAVGEHVQMQCEAVGNPKPTFVWKWISKNGKIYLNEVRSQKRFEVETIHRQESSVSILKIRNVQSTDFREYTCSAKNYLGISQTRIRLMKYGVPDRPEILGILTNGIKLDIFWKYGEDGGKQIDSVIIEYVSDHGHKWKNITIVDLRTPRYILRNLHPQTEYRIRITVTNEIGKSLPTAIYIVRTGMSTRPRTPRIKKAFTHNDNLDIVLAFSNNDRIEKIESVIIEYAPVDDKKWTRITIKNPTTPSFTIENLCPDTDYKFRLFVKNEYGKSAPTKEQYIRTGSKLQTLATSALAVGIKWNYQTYRRKIKSMIIKYAMKNDSNDWSTFSITNPNITCFIITGLHPLTEYKIRIYATDEEEDILGSALHHIKTGVAEKNNGQIKVSWKEKLSFAKIQYAPIHSDQWHIVNAINTTRYIIKNVQPGTLYKLRLSVMKKPGELNLKRRLFYRRAVHPNSHECNNASTPVDINLSYVQHSDVSKHDSTPTSQPKDRLLLTIRNIILLAVGAAFIMIIFIVIWILRQKMKKDCLVKQLNGNAKFNSPNEDNETVL